MPDNQSDLVVSAPIAPVVPVAGTDARFPVRRIYCVGRNYAAHIREMNQDERDPPFFFQKPTDSIVLDGAAVAYPTRTSDFQFEIELVLAIGTGGADISVEDAHRHVFGVAAGVDLTRRDLQLTARNTGRPWETGKSFDESAPIGTILPLDGGALPDAGRIHLTVNGDLRQDGDIGEMIWSSAEIVSELSQLFRLEPGDLIYTGTPAGVGPIKPGDLVEGAVQGVGTVAFTVAG